MQGIAAAATPVAGIAFGPEGMVVVAHHDGVVVRSVADGAVKEKIAIDMKRVGTIAIDGNVLVVGGGTPGQRGKVVLWDWKAKRIAAEMEGFKDVVTGVAI